MKKINGLSKELSQEEFDAAIDEMPADVLQYVAQAFSPWQSPTRENDQAFLDSDGFEVGGVSTTDFKKFPQMQKACWEKFNTNPHLNSHVRDVMGNMTGYGWDIASEITEIDDLIYEETYDIRNELYKNFPKYVARSEIEGELFLALTVHLDGFVEVDFMDPSSLKGGGDYNSGIFFHPKKLTMPLFYKFEVKDDRGNSVSQVFPSIYVAHYPEFAKLIENKGKITQEELKMAKTTSKKHKSIGGFKTFIVSWDRGFLTPRNLSHISTTLEWINHYVNLKKWEIDHKKSAGSYLWVVSLTDTKAFRTWLKMTDTQKNETGLTAKKTPGGTLILPPGVTIEVKSPTLPTISEQDTDIMHMITSGLNKPEDMVTGQTKGDTFSGVKASRGPDVDRTHHETAFFERFLRYDFWRSIFILKNKVINSTLKYKVKKATSFKEKKPIFENRIFPPWELIDFDFPVSESGDVEGLARAYLGVKHPSVVEVLGIPRSAIAKKLGFAKYGKSRLQYETEEELLPDLPLTAELDSIQEGAQEPTLPDNKNKDKDIKPVKKEEKVKLIRRKK